MTGIKPSLTYQVQELNRCVRIRMQEIEDSYLLEKFSKEETRNYAFNLLVTKYQKKLYWHIRRMVLSHEDADDVLQNVFIKVWKYLESFQQDSSMYTWLYRIATNECLTFLKKKRSRFFLSIVNVESQLIEVLESDEYYSGDEVDLIFQKAILTLPEKQRLVFNMKYYQEMTYEEMSAIVDTSVGALKASYHQAVKKIQKYISEN